MDHDTFVGVSIDNEVPGEFTLRLWKSDVRGQTFACLQLRDVDLPKLLRGEKITSRFQMWEPPK